MTSRTELLGNASMVEIEGRGVGLDGAFYDAVTGMAVLDLEGRFRSVNPALCRMVGRSEAELVGLRPVDVTHPEDRLLSASTMDALLAGETDTDQVRKRYLRPDGTVLVGARTTTVLRDGTGRLVGLFTQVVDVTDMAEAQEALRRSEKRFRALVAHSSEMTVLVDRAGAIVYASPASWHLLGRSPDSLEGHPALDFVHPDDLERARRAFGAHMAGSGVTGAVEYRVGHPDGRWCDAEVLTTNLFDDPDVGALVLNIRDVTEQRRHRGQLEASERRLRALVGNSWDVISLHDPDGRYLYCSPAVTEQLGYRPDELIGTDPFVLIHPDDAHAASGFSRTAAGAASGVGLEYRVRHRNGTWRWVESTGHNRLHDPAVAGIVVTTRDVTARRRRAAQQDAVAALSGEALRGGRVEELFASAVAVVAAVLGIEHCALLRADGDGRLSVVAHHGPSAEHPLPIVDTGRPGGMLAQLRDRAPILWGAAAGPAPAGLVGDWLAGGIQSGAAVVVLDGEHPYGILSAYSAEPDAFGRDDLSFLEAAANVLAAAIGRRRIEQELRHRALHDHLTGLPNRGLFLERLAGALVRLDRHPGSIAVLFVDTDDFKLVNDSLGHAAGDRVVNSVAERIVGVLRQSDAVARFGGDEFVVLCEDTDADRAVRVAERIRQALATPIDLPGRPVVVTASVGIAVTADGTLTADDLLAQADTAMYVAKQAGKDRSATFDHHMRRQVTERLDAASGLRRALSAEELRLYYQPVVDTETGMVIGAEALMRWEHPTEGLLGPGRFIDYAESSGLIIPMGAWALDTACRQAATWAALGSPGHLSVNLSARQLAETDLVATVKRALERSGVDPALIFLEVTESAVMSDLQRSAKVMGQLLDLGVHVGMDDFGTGHSSLSHLANLPFNFVKIDRSFVARFDQDRRAAALLETIATLCRTLDLAAVAEGVETEAQLQRVSELGIPFIQGFLFGPPVPAESFRHGVPRGR